VISNKSLATKFFVDSICKLENIPEWNDEIDYIRDLLDRGTTGLTAHQFYRQYCFVVLCSYWKEQYARKEWEKFFETGDFNVISNRKKRAAIIKASDMAKSWYDELMAREDKDKLEYIRTLPWMGGEALGYHLARNIGIDCVKPDRHMKRFAKRFGFETPLELCQHVKDDLGGLEKVGLIDLVFWRTANLYIQKEHIIVGEDA
jgi:hypothetical protein